MRHIECPIGDHYANAKIETNRYHKWKVESEQTNSSKIGWLRFIRDFNRTANVPISKSEVSKRKIYWRRTQYYQKVNNKPFSVCFRNSSRPIKWRGLQIRPSFNNPCKGKNPRQQTRRYLQKEKECCWSIQLIEYHFSPPEKNQPNIISKRDVGSNVNKTPVQHRDIFRLFTFHQLSHSYFGRGIRSEN